MIKDILFAGTGGFIGASARFCVFYAVNLFGIMHYWGTLTVNVLGCFAAGVVIAIPHDILGGNMRILIASGFLGGFSTFSAFSTDTLFLLKNGNIYTALMTIFLNFILSCGGAAIGYEIMRAFLKSKGIGI